MTERAEVSFTVKESASGTPWIRPDQTYSGERWDLIWHPILN